MHDKQQLTCCTSGQLKCEYRASRGCYGESSTDRTRQCCVCGVLLLTSFEQPLPIMQDREELAQNNSRRADCTIVWSFSTSLHSSLALVCDGLVWKANGRGPVRCSEKGKCSWKLLHVCTLNVSQAVALIFDSSSVMEFYSRYLVKSDRNLMQRLTVGSPGSYLMLTFRTYFYAARA